ncbi:MAG: DNA primase, partial [Oscillospiraceae bacterium]|nr:DNA primase [Oscillospiraceae bacterium]
MPIPDSFLDELVSRTDIVELVGGYVRFAKRSGGNMLGLCPFHSEKTPSFSVNADKQIYHCFGCGKGGGAIGFVMEIENIPFLDAVDFLAKRAGMTVPESGGEIELAEKRRRMLELNRDAAMHFHKMLLAPQGASAQKYLAARGISKSMVTRFGIGAAPDSWNALLDAMSAKGYSRNELIEAGLARRGKTEGGAYDMFRNRLIFPVIDVRGNVIGFSGRILGDGEPKYLNSPDTLAFSKSRNLFALNIAKKTKSGMLILVEGNIDVITMHQAGFDCAVASLGTALTAEQVKLMSRYTDRAFVAYDSDEAGRKAALKAISLLEKTGMQVKIVSIGDSKDPDEFLRKHGADSFRLLLEGSENHIEYRLMTIRNNADLSTDEGRLAYLAAATGLLSELSSKPEREIY